MNVSAPATRPFTSMNQRTPFVSFDSMSYPLLLGGISIGARPIAAFGSHHRVDGGPLGRGALARHGRRPRLPWRPSSDASSPAGTNKRSAGDDWGQRCELLFGVEVVKPALQACLELVGTLPRLGRVHSALRQLASQLPVLQLVRAVVPVLDF